ncbi:hypothetical protein Sros01_79610 [Streptomyces roseochromogenus]|nr:hypothetical protein Sros01_79610 [Streptomyces roseochromogenus]
MRACGTTASAEAAVLERGEPGDVLVPDLVALGAEPGGCGGRVHRHPERDGVEDRAERAELVLHPGAVRLVDGDTLTVAHVAGELVAGLLDGERPRPDWALSHSGAQSGMAQAR